MSAQLGFFGEIREGVRQHRTDWTCRSCGLAWEDGCSRSDWTWIDEGRVGMDRCWRCGAVVCHHCYARSDESHVILCPACFVLPPMTDEECARHIYAHNGPEYVRSAIAWRYDVPNAQTCSINPVMVWYWQTRDGWTAAQQSIAWSVAGGSATSAVSAAAWLPAWVRRQAVETAASRSASSPTPDAYDEESEADTFDDEGAADDTYEGDDDETADNQHSTSHRRQSLCPHHP